MNRYAYDLIDIPERAGKPRTNGLALVRSPGMGLTAQRGFPEEAGNFVDYVKFASVTPRIYRESLFGEKFRLYRQHDVGAMSGGIFSSSPGGSRNSTGTSRLSRKWDSVLSRSGTVCWKFR